jgi:hypothetical protein
VTISSDAKQRFVYCHKDNEFDSLHHKAVELEESKQRAEQARIELRGRDEYHIKQRYALFGVRLTEAEEQLAQARESS